MSVGEMAMMKRLRVRGEIVQMLGHVRCTDGKISASDAQRVLKPGYMNSDVGAALPSTVDHRLASLVNWACCRRCIRIVVGNFSTEKSAL